MVWHVFVCTSVRTSYHFASLTTRRRVLSTEVCPGFGDQPVNAARAESLQIGRKVSRPMGRLEEVEAEKEAYRSWVEDRLKLFFLLEFDVKDVVSRMSNVESRGAVGLEHLCAKAHLGSKGAS